MIRYLVVAPVSNVQFMISLFIFPVIAAASAWLLQAMTAAWEYWTEANLIATRNSVSRSLCIVLWGFV